MKSTLTGSILLLAVALLLSADTYAQKRPHVKFGYLDATQMSIFQILGNPKLTCKEGNCEVLSYNLRISRRDKDAYGPYHIEGSELPENIQKLIKTKTARRGTLFFEDIRVRYNGKEMLLPDDYRLPYINDVDRGRSHLDNHFL